MAFATEIGGRGGQVLGITTFRADMALHQGRTDEAVEILETGPEVFLFWWRPHYLATRAEAFARAGDERAEAALAEARKGMGDNPYARALTVRAAAQRDDDESGLREALAIFERIGCPYQAARTGWLLGGEERAAAESTFARLGATLPA
jgi:hypothetical protein